MEPGGFSFAQFSTGFAVAADPRFRTSFRSHSVFKRWTRAGRQGHVALPLLPGTAGGNDMKPALKLSNVGMRFAMNSGGERGHFQALSELDLEVNRGDKLGLIGGNGAGKSTLLRIMAGIYPPGSGTVWRAPGLSIALLSLGLGFKNDLTGRENALLAAVLQGMSKSEAKTHLNAIGEFTELGRFYDEPVKSYSSGMRTRLGFATGLLLDTDILLLDEILAVGDQSFRNKAREALSQKLTEDRTVILVHHAENAIREICSRVVWIEQGQIKADGATVEVLEAYANAS